MGETHAAILTRASKPTFLSFLSLSFLCLPPLKYICDTMYSTPLITKLIIKVDTVNNKVLRATYHLVVPTDINF